MSPSYKRANKHAAETNKQTHKVNIDTDHRRKNRSTNRQTDTRTHRKKKKPLISKKLREELRRRD